MPHITLLVIQSVSAQWRRSCFYKGFLIILLNKRIARKRQLKINLTRDALQDILEEENITVQAENLATTEEEQFSGFEGPAEVDVTFWSKDGNLSWSSSPTEKKGRLSTENVIKMTPGLTKYATSRIEDIKSCFNLFLAEPIENIVISMTNLEGRRVYKENWNEVDRTDIKAYIGLLILWGSTSPEMKTSPVYGMQTQVGQFFVPLCLNRHFMCYHG